MDHSYEEIRNVALDILAGRERVSWDSNQFQHLQIGVGEVFERRESPAGRVPERHSSSQLSASDRELFLEVFWDLFRQGIITLGFNDSNREFPFFGSPS